MKKSIQKNSVSELVYVNDLRPADVIIARKFELGMLDHYVVYLGVNPANGLHFFAANLGSSVSILTPANIKQLTAIYGPVSIRKFQGNDYQRKQALERAMAKFEQNKPYNLLTNNCEHYANYVQTGAEYSQQVSIAYGTVAAVGFGAALTSKNPWVQLFGVVAGIAGTAAAISEESNRPAPEQEKLAAARIPVIRRG